MEKLVSSIGSTLVASRRWRNFRELPEDEYNRRMRERLCFQCDEKFVPGHVCKNKALRMLWVES